MEKIFFAAAVADIQPVADRLMVSKFVEDAGYLERNARADNDHVHTGQHRAVERCHIRHLHLLQQVDAYRVVMPFFGKKNLHEISDDG